MTAEIEARSIISHVFGPAANSPSKRRKAAIPSRIGPFRSRQSIINFKSLAEAAKSSGKKFSEIALEYEAWVKSMPQGDAREQMGRLLEGMFTAIKRGLDNRDPIDGKREGNAHKFVTIATKFPCSQAEFIRLAGVINKLGKKKRLTDQERRYFERWKFILTDPFVKRIFEMRKGDAVFEKGEANPGGGYEKDLYRELTEWWRENPSVSGLYIKAAGYAFAAAELSVRGGKAAAPAAGTGGIIPGVLKAMQECFVYSKEELFTPERLTEALFTAGFVGLFFSDNLRSNVGSAAAMAAAAATELLGGDPVDVMHAVGFVLEGVRGLPNLPIGNAFGAVVAITAATLATNKYRSDSALILS